MTFEPRGAFGAAWREMKQGNEELREQYYVKLEYMSLKEIQVFYRILGEVSKEIRTAKSLLEKFKTKALTPEEEKEYLTLNGPTVK